MADDALSQVAWSEFSETDRMLFTVLSNPERIDVAALPAQPLRYDDRIEELPRITEEEPRAVGTVQPSMRLPT